MARARSPTETCSPVETTTSCSRWLGRLASAEVSLSRRIVLDGRSLTLEQVALAAAGGARIEIAQAARERVRAARKLVDRIAESGVPTYGINTGFGTLAEVSIARPDLQRLQRNLILSHA